jgi:hypothetical protein
MILATGKFNGWAFEAFVAPIAAVWRDVLQRTVEMVVIMENHIRGDSPREDLEKALELLSQARVAIRHAFLNLRQQHYTVMATANQVSPGREKH